MESGRTHIEEVMVVVMRISSFSVPRSVYENYARPDLRAKGGYELI